MTQRIYMQYDRVAGVFSDPFVCTSGEEAKRLYAKIIDSPQPNAFNTFAEDKELYFVAEFDTHNGVVTAPEKPVFICKSKVEYNG